MIDENIKSLIKISIELESFKHKVYTLLNKEQWLDDFIMNNVPCNYNLMEIVTKIQNGTMSFKVKGCQDYIFHGIGCLESEDRFGFFKSEEDVRPSQCTWINKQDAENFYEMLKKYDMNMLN